MSLTVEEIELGRLAIERQLATRAQVRECAELRSTGNPEHLAKLLVSRGYVAEGAARTLFQEVRSGSRVGAGVGSSGAARPGSWPASEPPGSTGTATFGAAVTCPTCHSRTSAPTAGPVRCPVRCIGCGGMISAGTSAPVNGSGSGFGTGAPVHGAANGHANGSGYGSGSAFGPPVGTPVGAANAGTGYGKADYGPNGTHNQRGGALGFAAKETGSGSGMYPETGSEGDMALLGEDPIAGAMSVRQNADGSSETVFGPYDILGEIARGGMGIVYRARQRSLKRIVALKVMKEGENASEKQIRRFKRETEAAAKLQHPNIVAVHEVGCHAAFHYFTMDLIEGDPLDAIVKRKEKMPVRRVLEIVKEVAQAIHYAHGKGIIHRDLKPANILLDTDGHPKVTDFGLAKQIDHKSMLTRTGSVVGTPFYMPPEQARGDVDIDQRADVYALGVILYELLTLKLPFHGETTMEVYHKILEEEPLPPRKHDSRLDRDVDTIVLKAMDKDVNRRYQTSQDLAEDIQRYLNGDPIKARPLGPIGRAIKKAKKNLPTVVVATVTAVAILSAGGLFYWKYRQDVEARIAKAQNTEFDGFKAEVENQCITARSQITSGIARQRDRDLQGALADLEEAARILDDLPLLAQGVRFTEHNQPERNLGLLEEKRAETDAIYREVCLESGRTHALQGSEQGFALALDAFERGLARCPTPSSPEALLLRLEVGKVRARQGRYDEAQRTFTEVLEADPKHVDARLELGLVHELAGDPLEAIECFSRVLEQDSKVIRGYLLRGATQFRIGRFEDALTDFHKVLDLKNDMFEGWLWRGRTQAALGHYGDAQDDLTEAIDITPSLPDGYFHRAELHFAQRRLPQAIKDYEVAISRSAQFYAAYLGLGEALEWTLDYERAAQQYEEVLRGREREAEAVKPRAQAALARLDLVRADPFVSRLEVEDRYRQEHATSDGALGAPPPLDQLNVGAAALRKERLDSARARYDEALEADPELIPALLGRAALALTEDDRPGARQTIDRLLSALDRRLRVRFQEKGPEEDEDEEEEAGWEEEAVWEEVGGELELRLNADRDLAMAHVLAGRLALREERLDDARKHFKRALKGDALCAGGKAGMGHVRHAQGKAEAAAELFAESRTLQLTSGDEASFFFAEGKTHAAEAERSKKPEFFKQADQAFARAVAVDPLHARSWLERARLCAGWSNPDLAVSLATRAVEADPNLREGYELLGFLFTRDLPATRSAETGRPEHLRDPARGEAEFDRAIAVANTAEEAANAFYGRALAHLAQAAPLGAEIGGDAGEIGAQIDGQIDGQDPRVQRAQQDLEQAVKAIPEDFRQAEPRRINQSISYLQLMARVRRLMGDEAGAEAALKRVEEVKAEARAAAEDELLEGQSLRDRLNYADAIKRFDRAIELNPEFDKAYYDRGTCYLKIGNFVPGILDFSRALELNPRIADQVYNKVYQISYVVDLNRVITELNKIVSDHPTVSYVVFLRGFFYVAKTEFKQVNREDLELGIADFDRCLELNPTHVTALLYRGFLWMKMAAKETDPAAKHACFDRAMADHHHALELDPESGISHYLQGLCWSVMSQEEGLTPEEVADHKAKALAELARSFECEFKGYERIRNESGFDPIRETDEFKKLMQGK